MLNVSLNELKQITKMRRIKGYNNMLKERFLSIFSQSESARSKKNLDNAKIKKIREDFNKLKLKPKIKEIRKNLYEIENKKSLSESKATEIKRNLFELEESLSRHKNYNEYDDFKYKGTRDVGNLFNQSIIKIIISH